MNPGSFLINRLSSYFFAKINLEDTKNINFILQTELHLPLFLALEISSVQNGIYKYFVIKNVASFYHQCRHWTDNLQF